MNQRMPRAILIVSVAVLLATTACSSKSKVGTGGLTGVSAPPATAPAPTAPGTAAPTDTATSSTSTATGTHTTKATGPKIVTFGVKQKVACPVVGGGTSAPFTAPGQDLILEWNVSGATKVALSLDDKNWFKNNHTGSIASDLPPTGSMTVPFVCDQTQQPNTTHTYTLDAENGTAEKTISVSAQTDP